MAQQKAKQATEWLDLKKERSQFLINLTEKSGNKQEVSKRVSGL